LCFASFTPQLVVRLHAHLFHPYYCLPCARFAGYKSPPTFTKSHLV